MPSAAATESFSAATKEYAFDAVLSDFDGTILDTTPASSILIDCASSIASELGIDPETVLATSHGRRTLDTLALYDTSKANWDYVSSIEARIPREFSTNSDVSEVPGSRELLTALQKAGARWGIVTSGTRALISGWVDRLGLVRPSMLIAAEDVHVGKPDPQGYLLGRKQLGLRGDESSVLVIEDAPAGIRAGKAAGFKVLAVKTSHSVEQLRAAGPDWIVEDLRSVSVRGVESGLVKVEITAAFM